MPPPSNTAHLPSSHPANRQRPKSPNRVLAEAEAQWLFTEAELANTPSVQDGMSLEEERDIRAKGVTFIIQVGIMLKLPQLTLSTAAIFLQRFLMRASLKKARNGIPKLHHFQIAATALFLATKVEESCRKLKDMILAFCRVAQKNPNLVIKEDNKDWWRWRDSLLYNEDILLETLCFDLTVESPHRQLFDLLKWFGVEHNKRLRNQAWAFVTDANNTQLCLLCTSRTIAVAALYAACRYCSISLPDDSAGRPWWETQQVKLPDIKKALDYMCANYESTTNKLNGSTAPANDGEQSIYQGLSTPMDGANDVTRQKEGQPLASPAPNSERRNSNASSIGMKREREADPAVMNGNKAASNGVHTTTIEDGSKRQRLDTEGDSTRQLEAKNDPSDALHQEEAARVQNGNKQSEKDVQAAAKEEGEASEEGEVEE